MSKSARGRKALTGLVIIALIALGCYLWVRHNDATTTSPTHEQRSQHSGTKPVAKNDFDKTKYSLTDPTSLWVVVNKLRPLNPANYVPADLVVPDVPERVSGTQVSQKMVPSLTQMFADAKTAGTPMKVSSGYRSYTYQVSLYNGYVKSEGQTQADQESARPGYSEHQTGLAADLASLSGGCSVEQCWADTTAGKWLSANAYKYGFIVRYPDGLTNVTGYEYEPWHVRYVGVQLATEMHNDGVQTLEQFFGLPDAPDYQ